MAVALAFQVASVKEITDLSVASAQVPEEFAVKNELQNLALLIDAAAKDVISSIGWVDFWSWSRTASSILRSEIIRGMPPHIGDAAAFDNCLHEKIRPSGHP
uniref:hypothetical protein n=1 Tax=Cupriavidus yeoncheonensis TaxID=1462994 RepID=UPI003F49AA40